MHRHLLSLGSIVGRARLSCHRAPVVEEVVSLNQPRLISIFMVSCASPTTTSSRRRLTVTWPAAIALGIIVVACGGPTTSLPPGAVSAPSAAVVPSTTVGPSHTSRPSPTAGPLPAALRYMWVGPTRVLPELVPPPITSFLEVTATTMKFNAADTGPRILSSRASLDSGGTLEFKLDADDSGCHAGDLGRYSFTVSPSGRALSLKAIADACPIRVAAIAGDWIRSHCPSPLNPCLGEVDPGDHASVVFTPFVPPSRWQYKYGRFAYTVPAGWVNMEDALDDYVLAQDGAPDSAGIFMVAGVAAHSQAATCPEKRDPAIGTSATAITRWLTALPNLVTSTPKPVTIGGLNGFTFDVAVDPKATHTCPFTDGKTGASLFSVFDPAAGFDWGIWGDGRMRLFLLDLGDARTLMIDIEAQDKATWDALLPKAMPIVERYRFRH
jgi:hypothetical protein